MMYSIGIKALLSELCITILRRYTKLIVKAFDKRQQIHRRHPQIPDLPRHLVRLYRSLRYHPRYNHGADADGRKVCFRPQLPESRQQRRSYRHRRRDGPSRSVVTNDEGHGVSATGAVAFLIRNILHVDGTEDGDADQGEPCPRRGAQRVAAVRNDGGTLREAKVQAGVKQVTYQTAGVSATEIVVSKAQGHEHDARDRGLEVPAHAESCKVRSHHEAEGRGRGDALGRHGAPGLVGAVLEHGFRLTLIVDIEGEEIDPDPEKDQRHSGEDGGDGGHGACGE